MTGLAGVHTAGRQHRSGDRRDGECRRHDRHIERDSTPATLIDLGGADTANTLGLTDAELDGITAGILRVGDLTSGRIGFSDAITLGRNEPSWSSTTGADIQDNHFGPDVTVVSLAMTASTGIGTASSALGTTVSVIEAQTNTGGINISNTGPVFVGGVTGSLSGLRVVTSGDLSFSAGGTITLQDTDGVEIVAGGSASGNVLLSATGAAADVTATVNKDAITASAGSITVAAGRDILLGTVGTDFDNDVRANGSVTLSAGRDLVSTAAANVISDAFGNNTGGGVIATVGDDIEVTFVHRHGRLHRCERQRRRRRHLDHGGERCPDPQLGPVAPCSRIPATSRSMRTGW